MPSFKRGFTVPLSDLVAGTETTSTALLWVKLSQISGRTSLNPLQWIKSMTSDPDVQVKLRGYIRTTLSSKQLGDLEMDDLTPDKTPFLEAMVYETLRFGRIALYARRGERFLLQAHC